MVNSPNSNGVVVLTTHERSELYTRVLGNGADMRFHSHEGYELEDLLHNVTVARGGLVVIDEAFFVDPNDMPIGLESFVNNERSSHMPRLIVVCSNRGPGDALLAHLVLYCGIYNIIYGKSGLDLSIEFERLLQEDNTRDDVLELVEIGKWESARHYMELVAEELPASGDTHTFCCEFKPIHDLHFINVENAHVLRMNIEIEECGGMPGKGER